MATSPAWPHKSQTSPSRNCHDPCRPAVAAAHLRAAGLVDTLAQLKIVQEVITLAIFVPFAVFFMQQPLKLDCVWAGLCMVGAVHFIFRS